MTMPRLLIQNVDAITLDEQNRVLKNTNIAIEGKRIVAVGEVPQGFVADETIDGHDHVALPGLFNAHTHAAMSLQRGWAEDLPLDRWFNERIWVAESALTEEDVYWGAALAACEMIRGGTVAFADHYFWMHQVARVVEESGLKALLAWCVFGLGAEQEIGGTTLERTVEFVAQYQNAADGRIKTILGPHSPYICSPEFLRRAAEAAAKLGVGIHLHVAESQGQFDQSMREHGKSPVAHLAALGVLDVPTLAGHTICVTDEDIAILAEKRASVVQCPKTHLKLAMGTTRVPDLIAVGVNVALGTDGAASNNDHDMIGVTRLAALAQKQARHDPEVLPSMQALKLATQNGARAMGFGDSGVLKAGAAADVILFNFNRPHLRPRHDLAANIVHSARADDVAYNIVDGRVLLRNGELTTLDEDKILHEAEKRAFRLVGQELRMVREYKA
ncbi:MAG: amidohydrolase [Chloroflexi bacterium]|nr:amidohydrolase [Chloroflexota bacterium]